jgi:hypothetical protein
MEAHRKTIDIGEERHPHRHNKNNIDIKNKKHFFQIPKNKHASP